MRQLDFTPMDAFMAHVLESFKLDCELAIKVFPPSAGVVLTFCDRVAQDVIGEYVQALLSQTRVMSQELSLQATAASFIQSWKLVDTTMELLGGKASEAHRLSIEKSVYDMFEQHMDEYLEDETEWTQNALNGICNAWDAQLGTKTGAIAGSVEARLAATAAGQPQFLTSQNPDQVKRNVLAGFKDALLLPVTIVPRTVSFGVNAIVAGGSHAVAGLSMLNPQKWTASTSTTSQAKGTTGKMVNGEVIFDTAKVPTPDWIEEESAVEIDVVTEKIADLEVNGTKDESGEVDEVDTLTVPGVRTTASGVSTPVSTTSAKESNNDFERLQLLVSLDTALELIHGDRESLKRTETFAKYPGKCGTKVVETVEELFILLLKAIGDRHIAPGFRIATKQMLTYKPADHDETASVAPLLQFFELVHVGDTIQSMVQVYFDKEIGQYVDKTDFLNPVMREKKRFEGVLDDAVAAGLNAGIEVLMNQVRSADGDRQLISGRAHRHGQDGASRILPRAWGAVRARSDVRMPRSDRVPGDALQPVEGQYFERST